MAWLTGWTVIVVAFFVGGTYWASPDRDSVDWPELFAVTIVFALFTGVAGLAVLRSLASDIQEWKGRAEKRLDGLIDWRAFCAFGLVLPIVAGLGPVLITSRTEASFATMAQVDATLVIAVVLGDIRRTFAPLESGGRQDSANGAKLGLLFAAILGTFAALLGTLFAEADPPGIADQAGGLVILSGFGLYAAGAALLLIFINAFRRLFPTTPESEDRPDAWS